MKTKIIKVNYGLSSIYPNKCIEINRKLTGCLRNRVLAHEKRHIQDKYSLKDWQNDFQAKKPYFFEAFWWSLKHPESLINYFLFMYSYYFKILTFNNSAVFPFLWFGLIWALFWVFGFKIALLPAFIGWLVIYTLTNLILLIYTHLYLYFSELKY